MSGRRCTDLDRRLVRVGDDCEFTILYCDSIEL
jgi:hypothetical protein